MTEENKWTTEQFMPKVDGKSFRCDCGCNVFTRRVGDDTLYKCNSCDARYRGER